MLRSNKADLLWFVLLAILVVGVIPYTLLPVKVAETGELVFGVTEILPQWMIGGLMALLLMLLGAVRLDTNARWASLGGILPLALAAAFFPIERQV